LMASHYFQWDHLRNVLTCLIIVLGIIFSFLVYSCIKMKWPAVPRGVPCITVGSWTALAVLPGLCVAVLSMHHYNKYCNYIVELDVIPIIHICLFLLFGAVLLILFGVHQHLLGQRSMSGKVTYNDACVCGPTQEVDGETLDAEQCVLPSPRQSYSFSSRSLSSVSSMSDAADLGGLREPHQYRLSSRNFTHQMNPAEIEPLIAEEKECSAVECMKAMMPMEWTDLTARNCALGPFCFTGFRSWREVRSRICGDERHTKDLPPTKWDCGLCIISQALAGSFALLLLSAYTWHYAYVAPQYETMRAELDSKWGFVMQQGHDYTAPVWMGEFGTGERNTYWLNFVRYLAERDLDWAYWPLNPDRQMDGEFDNWGKWHEFHQVKWVRDTYSVLSDDYMTVRDPWRMLDLDAIMSSPAVLVSNSMPCDPDNPLEDCGE